MGQGTFGRDVHGSAACPQRHLGQKVRAHRPHFSLYVSVLMVRESTLKKGALMRNNGPDGPSSGNVVTEPTNRLLDVWDVAGYLGIPAQTLYAWRVTDRGPRGIKIGRHLRYRRADVESWLEAHADDRPPAA